MAVAADTDIRGGFDPPDPKGPGRAPGPVRLGKAPGPVRLGKAPAKAKGPADSGYNTPLYHPDQMLAGKQLGNAATQLANVQTQGPLSDLAAQIARNEQQGTASQSQTFGYYMQLAKQAQDSLAQEKSIGSGLNSQLASNAANTQGQLAGFGQQAQGGALGRMTGMGLDGGGAQNVAAETARQQGLAANNSLSSENFGAAQGANYASNAASNLGTFALRGQERLGDIARATRLQNVPLTQKQADLMAKKGALESTALGQLRTQERNYSVAQQGLGLKKDSLQLTAANDAARNALTARGQNVSASNNAANNAQSNLNNLRSTSTSAANQQARLDAKIGAGNGTKPASAGYQAKVYGQLNKAIGVIQQAQAFTGDSSHPGKFTEAEIRRNVGAKYGIPDYLIEAAYELLGYGALSPRTAGYFYSIGLRGGTYNGQPIKVGGNVGSSIARSGGGLGL